MASVNKSQIKWLLKRCSTSRAIGSFQHHQRRVPTCHRTEAKSSTTYFLTRVTVVRKGYVQSGVLNKFTLCQQQLNLHLFGILSPLSQCILQFCNSVTGVVTQELFGCHLCAFLAQSPSQKRLCSRRCRYCECAARV